MKSLRALGLVVLACAVCTPAGATEVVHLDLARSKFDYPDIGSASGFHANFEHRFDGHPFDLGVGYYDSGKADIQGFPGLTVNFSGFDVLGTFSVPPTPDSKSRFLIGGGLYNGSFKVAQGSASVSKKSTGLTLSVGFDWMFSESVGARFGYQNYLKVKDFGDNKDIGMLQAGFVVAWGGAPPVQTREPAAAAPPPPAPTPETTPPSATPPAPAPAQTPAPAPAPAPTPPPAAPTPAPAPAAATPAPAAEPPAPAPTALAIGGTAKLRDGAFGRNRPTPDGAAATGLETGTIVNLKSTMNNTTGAWWFVVAPNASGWARAQDLEPQP